MTSIPEKRLRRFFSSEVIREADQLVRIGEEETRHLHQTIRLKKGDLCLILDPSGMEAVALIESIEKNSAVLKVLELTAEKQGNKKFSIRVCQALLQKGKMDEIVEKAQELGVSELIPITTERTIVHWKPDAQAQVFNRWQKMITSAAKQSGSLEWMKILEPVSFLDSLNRYTESALILLHPGSGSFSLKKVLESLDEKKNKAVTFWIGPEGGFNQNEVDMALKNNIRVAHLGSSVLRADTAFISAVSFARIWHAE